jgi:hypothetical protein
MDKAIQRKPIVYIRYLDHVLYKNTPKAVENPVERETIGWLTHENDQLICLENDRTIDELPYFNGSGSGLVILKSCILEIRISKLESFSPLSLISRNKYTLSVESALQTKKRKIQPQS